MTAWCSRGHLELSSEEIKVPPSGFRPYQPPEVLLTRVLFTAQKVRTSKILVRPGLLVGMLLILLMSDAVPAQAARCSYPTQFYRSSLGVCEAKAGNALYRAGSARKNVSKKVKSVRRLEVARHRPTAVPRLAVEPEIISKAKAVLVTTPEPQHEEDQIADFEARWWPIREVSDHQSSSF
jgi:hypothetical protein